jgi:O-antigen/teichoic acid export membrane protein
MPEAAADPSEHREAARAADRAYTKRGAATNLLTLVGQSTSLLYGTLAARLFGQAAWGSYTTALAWLDVLIRFALVGNDKGLLVLLAARRGKGDERGVMRALATALRVTAVGGLFCALAMAGSSWLVVRLNGQALDGVALRIMAPLALTSSLTTAMLAATIATKTLRFNLFSRGIAEPALLLGLMTILGLLAPSMGTLAATGVLAGTAALVVAIAGLLKRFDRRQLLSALRNEPTEREVIRYTAPLAVGELINVVVFRLPIIVLLFYVTPAQRAIFNTCLLLASSVSFLRGTFDAILAPIAAEAWAAGDRPRLIENLQRQSRFVLFAAIPLGSIFIVGAPSLLALFGPGFLSGGRAMGWLATAHVLNASFGLIGWVHLASGRTRLVLINNVAMLAVNVTLCLILIPRFGIEGAAISTALTLLTSQLLYGLEAYAFARIHVWSSGFVRLIVIGAGLLGGEIVVSNLLAATLGRAAIVVPLAGLPVYFALAWWGAGIRRDRGAGKARAAA